MRSLLQTVAWLACIVYSTIPSFWFMIHPFAAHWRKRCRSPFLVLVPAWILMWIAVAVITYPWHRVALSMTPWPWALAAPFFAIGIFLYSHSGGSFSAKHLGGLPEVHGAHREQQLVTTGIRSHVRHPVYLAHLCEMLGWSIGTGLLVCWALTAFAIASGTIMIQMEDKELEQRFGDSFREYRSAVPAVLPRFRPARQL